MKKRKCKLVLGNGFDLFGGMKTTFHQYYKLEVEKHITKLDDNITLFLSFLEDGVEEGDDYDDYKNDINQIKGHLNIWDYILGKHYLLGDPSLDYRNWFDFEKLLQDFVMKDLEDVCKYYMQISYEKKDVKAKIICNTSKQNAFCNIAIVYGLFRGFGSGISSYNFYEELVKFEKKFGNYVDAQFKSNKDNLIKKTRPFFDDIHKNYDISSIDTFNYTPIESNKYFKSLTNNIYHINGSTLTHPILGYDYNENDVFSERFSKTFRRVCSKEYCESYDSKYILMENFVDLVIFGHSLCEMDYSYYFPIFNYMHILEANYKNRIIIYYHNEGSNNRRNELLFALKDMLNQYTLEVEGKTNPRLIDSLSSQGRIIFVPVPK